MATSRSINRPDLLVAGANSSALFHAVVDRLAELLPNSSRTTIEQASHCMHAGNSTAYKRAVLTLHEQNTGPPPEPARPFNHNNAR